MSWLSKLGHPLCDQQHRPVWWNKKWHPWSAGASHQEYKEWDPLCCDWLKQSFKGHKNITKGKPGRIVIEKLRWDYILPKKGGSKGEATATVIKFPVRLAWGITLHKIHHIEVICVVCCLNHSCPVFCNGCRVQNFVANH